MKTGIIYNIDLTTNSKDIISVSSDEFNHFYIANINDVGDEIKYDRSESDTLSANFFMIKLENTNSDSAAIIEKIINQRNIVKVGISFTNGSYQEFDLAKKRVANNGLIQNMFEETFYDNNDLCIIITDKNIKYKENLFA